MRCLEKRSRIEQMKKNLCFNDFIKAINANDSLNLEPNLDVLVLYRKGVKVIDGIQDNKTENIKYKLNGKDRILNEEFINNIDKITSEFGRPNGDSEKEYQYSLEKKLNKNKQKGKKVYSVIPEYSLRQSGWRIDLILINFPEDSRPYLTLAEIKRGNKALTGNNGIKKHLDDFYSIIKNQPAILNTIVFDSALVFMQKVELGIIPEDIDIIKKLDIDIAKTESSFIFVDLDTNDRKFQKQLKEIKENINQYEDFPVTFSVVKSGEYDIANLKKKDINTFISSRMTTI